jgi:ferredoxin
MIKIMIDRKVCIGASACVAAAGKTFALDKEGKSTVINPQGDEKEKILAAEAGCPTRAIKVEESPVVAG